MPEKKKLGELLLEAKMISADQLRAALAHQKQWGGRLGAALVEKGFVSEETLVRFLSIQLKLSSVDLGSVKITPELAARIPRDMQERLVVLPVHVLKEGKRETLIVAMADPTDVRALDEIGFAAGTKVRPVVAAESAIKRILFGDKQLGSSFRERSVEQSIAGSLAPIGENQVELEVSGEIVLGDPLDEAPIARGVITGTGPAAPPGARMPAGPVTAPAPPPAAVRVAAPADPFAAAVLANARPSGAPAPVPPPMAVAAAPPPVTVAPPAPAARAPMPAAAAAATAPSAPPAPPSWNGIAQGAVAPPPPVVPAGASAARGPIAAPADGGTAFLGFQEDEDKTEFDIPVEVATQAPPPPATGAPAIDAGGDLEPPTLTRPSVHPPDPMIGELSQAGGEAIVATGALMTDEPAEEISLPGPEPLAPPPDLLFDAPSRSFAVPEDLELAELAEPTVLDENGPGGPPSAVAAAPGHGPRNPIGQVAASTEDVAPAAARAANPVPAQPPSLEATERDIDAETSVESPSFEPAAESFDAAASFEPPVESFDAAASFEPPVESFDDAASSEPPAANPEAEAASFEPPVETFEEAPGGDAAEPTSFEPPETFESPDETAAETHVSTLGTAAAADDAAASAETWDGPSPEAAPEFSPEAETSFAPPDETAPEAFVASDAGANAAADPARSAPASNPTSTAAGPVPVMTSLEHNADEGTVLNAGAFEPTWSGEPEQLADFDRPTATRESVLQHDEEPPPADAIAPAEEAMAPPEDATESTVPGEPAPAAPPEPLAVRVQVEATPAPAPVPEEPAKPAATEDQAALNAAITKKLKLLNAIAELLLEKGLITEDELKEKIAKKR